MSVSEILIRKKTRESRRLSKEKRKLRKESFLKKISCPSALDSEAVNFPSIIIREGKSLNQWLKRYWPEYFSEVFENGEPNTDPVMNAQFKKDFMSKFGEYISESNDALDEFSYAGPSDAVSLIKERKRVVLDKSESEKTSWFAADTSAKKTRLIPDDAVAPTSNYRSYKRTEKGVALDANKAKTFDTSSTELEILSDTESELKEVFEDGNTDSKFAAINPLGRSVRIRTNYTDRTIPIPPTIDKTITFVNPVVTKLRCPDEKKATYRRSVSFASEIAYKAHLFRETRKQKERGYATYESQMVSMPLIVNQGDIIQSSFKQVDAITGAKSLPHIHSFQINPEAKSQKFTSNYEPVEDPLSLPATVNETKDSEWVQVKDAILKEDQSKTTSRLAKRSVNDLAVERKNQKNSCNDDSSVGSSFHVKWVPGNGIEKKKVVLQLSGRFNNKEQSKSNANNSTQDDSKSEVSSAVQQRTPVKLQGYRPIALSSSVEDLTLEGKMRQRRNSDEGILADWTPELDLQTLNMADFPIAHDTDNNPTIRHAATSRKELTVVNNMAQWSTILSPNTFAPADLSREAYNRNLVNIRPSRLPTNMYLPPVDYDQSISQINADIVTSEESGKTSAYTQTTFPSYEISKTKTRTHPLYMYSDDSSSDFRSLQLNTKQSNPFGKKFHEYEDFNFDNNKGRKRKTKKPLRYRQLSSSESDYYEDCPKCIEFRRSRNWSMNKQFKSSTELRPIKEYIGEKKVDDLAANVTSYFQWQRSYSDDSLYQPNCNCYQTTTRNQSVHVRSSTSLLPLSLASNARQKELNKDRKFLIDVKATSLKNKLSDSSIKGVKSTKVTFRKKKQRRQKTQKNIPMTQTPSKRSKQITCTNITVTRQNKYKRTHVALVLQDSFSVANIVAMHLPLQTIVQYFIRLGIYSLFMRISGKLLCINNVYVSITIYFT